MSERPHRNPQQIILDKIVGDPPLIRTHQEIGSLMDAFTGAVTIFETPGTPDPIIKMSYDALKQRVAESRQEKAGECFDNFKRHYANAIRALTNPSASSGRDRRLRDNGTRRPLARGHR